MDIEARNEQIFQMWNHGTRTITEISDHFCLARTTIYGILLKKLMEILPKWMVWAEQKATALGHELQKPWQMPRRWDDEAVTACSRCGWKARITNRLALRGKAVKSRCPEAP